jgi:predicted transposase/invertase (TIGR01784 family)
MRAGYFNIAFGCGIQTAMGYYFRVARKHDNPNKSLFYHHKLVQELLESFVHEDFIKELDFSTLQRLDKSFITEEFKEKESDLIYKINFKNTPIYIFLLIEFQSTVDKFMALRFLRYMSEFYEYLVKSALIKV